MKLRIVAGLAMLTACIPLTLAAFRAESSQEPGPPPGPPGFPKGEEGPPPGFGPGTFLAPMIVEAADSDGDGKVSAEEAGKAAGELIRNAGKDEGGSLDAALLGKAINRRLRPPGVEPGEGPGDEFGPGTMMATPVLASADADKDGKLSPEEATNAAERFVREALGKESESPGLDEAALASAMNRRMGPPPGFGSGGPMGQERKIVKDHDKDRDGRLNAAERLAAREALKKAPAGGPRFGPFGGPGGPGGRRGGPPRFGPGGESPDPTPGETISPSDIASFPGKSLYDPAVVRTLFLDFEGKDWEAEMAEFYRTDVEVPAKLTVDGKVYPDVGVHFRGLSSFMMVRPGQKRSLNVSVDFAHPKQRLMGYKTLNLLNAHEDPTLLHTVLYLDIARRYIPAPKANFVRVVINGESWGLYSNAQQFDKTFLEESFKSSKGTRWKVPGNPGGDGGLRYLGDDVAEYKTRYQIKSDDGEKPWKDLVNLCRILNETPKEELVQALKGKLDIDGALWFLALENVFINNDGYWIRASDFSIFQDGAGVFHLVPHDANETFGPAMMMGPPGGGGMRRGPGAPAKKAGGPGGGPPGFGPGRGGPGGGGVGVALDPLYGMNDPGKPLRSKLLAVPELRARYLNNVRTLAETWLDWDKLGPLVAEYRSQIDAIVESDTKKLTSTEAYLKAVSDEITPEPEAKKEEPPRFGPGAPSMSLRTFAEKRRTYLLGHPEIKKLAP